MGKFERFWRIIDDQSRLWAHGMLTASVNGTFVTVALLPGCLHIWCLYEGHAFGIPGKYEVSGNFEPGGFETNHQLHWRKSCSTIENRRKWTVFAVLWIIRAYSMHGVSLFTIAANRMCIFFRIFSMNFWDFSSLSNKMRLFS